MSFSGKNGPIQVVLAFGLIFLILAAGWGCSSESKERSAPQKAVPVVVDSVTRKSVPVQLMAIGNVQPSTTVSIRSLVAGKIVGVHFKEGQEVKKGGLLFSFKSLDAKGLVRKGAQSLQRWDDKGANSEHHQKKDPLFHNFFSRVGTL